MTFDLASLPGDRGPENDEAAEEGTQGSDEEPRGAEQRSESASLAHLPLPFPLLLPGPDMSPVMSASWAHGIRARKSPGTVRGGSGTVPGTMVRPGSRTFRTEPPLGGVPGGTVHDRRGARRSRLVPGARPHETPRTVGRAARIGWVPWPYR